MRVLRLTFYLPQDAGGIATTVVRDSDIVDTLESMRVSMLNEEIPEEIPRPLMVFDIFEMEDGTIEEATAKALERLRPGTEGNMAILYYWCVDVILPQVTEGGAIVVPDPAPLDPDEIEDVLSQIALCRTYEKQTITVPAQDVMTVVKLSDGEVTRSV